MLGRVGYVASRWCTHAKVRPCTIRQCLMLHGLSRDRLYNIDRLYNLGLYPRTDLGLDVEARR